MTDSDVANLAVELEARGMAFYTRMAKKFEDDKVRQIFIKLAEEEKEHQKIFLKIAEETQDAEEVFNEPSIKYLNSIMKTTVFPHQDDEEHEIEKISQPNQAIAIGIQAEKDAILLYTEMYKHTNNTKAKETLSKLLEEEKLHLVDLRDYMDEI